MNFEDYFVKNVGPCLDPDRKDFFLVQIRPGQTPDIRIRFEFFSLWQYNGGNSDAR
jgi:hypothetical protein